MVLKKIHRGVHSGNTLRASNSRYSRRYHNQSCIVSRIHPDLLQKLVVGQQNRIAAAGGTADDRQTAKALQISNVPVDVALSLNKHARWLLPSALIRQVESDDIAQSDLTVSVLERHKLKRPASCVSFHSNKGEVKRIQPGNGRYFGFTYPASNGKSRRALRRELREQRKKKQPVTAEEKALAREVKKIGGKTVEVFTETGKVKIEPELTDSEIGIGEQEIRYEVFYPSPAKSSISHNPKYIKQDVFTPPGQEGEHVQHGKPKRQHRGKQRKRMSLRDIDDCDLPYHYHRQVRTSPDPDLDTIDDSTDSGHDDVITAEHTTTGFLLGALVEKAERLQRLVGVAKPRRRKKSGSTGVNPAGGHHQNDKSHIVYLNAEGTQENEDVDEIEDSPQASLPSSILPVIPAVTAEITRVLLPTSDVSMASLMDCFGQDYFEAACTPRKFVLDVTSNVRELLKKCGVQIQVADCTDDALSYVIFIHDGFYDDEFDVYKVFLNTRLRKGLLPVKINVEDQQDLYRGTVMSLVSCTMDFMEGFVYQLMEQKHFPWNLKDPNAKATNRQLQHHLASSEAYVPSVQRVFQLGSVISEVKTPSLSDMLTEEPSFCDVCYDDVTPLTSDSAAATSLLKCGHRVCDSCWAQHIYSRLHQGFVRVTCPGYDCQEDVKVGVLLSLADLDTVEKVLQRQEEVRIGASSTEKWCPNQSCDRVIRLKPVSAATQSATGSISERQLQQDVLCACGAHVCFQCLSQAHWPASCVQAEEYRRNVTTAVFPDRLAEVHEDIDTMTKWKVEERKTTLIVEGKNCPKCKNFVEKNGGCPQMTCRCGQLFCWFCGRPGYSHPDRGNGCMSEVWEKRMTTTMIVRHVDHSLNVKEENAKEQQKLNAASATRRQKVSLMERAAEHRQRRLNKRINVQYAKGITDMARVVASAARKDETVARQIIDVCSSGTLPSGSAKPSSTFSSSSSSSSSPDNATTKLSPRLQKSPNVMDVVTCFLKRVLHGQQELLEVTEYSLVLLKDLPDSRFRRRALRISEDLGAFSTFVSSILDTWARANACQGHPREVVKAVFRLAEIQGWINSAVASHVLTVRKLRSIALDGQ